jgi:hypothetical protein
MRNRFPVKILSAVGTDWFQFSRLIYMNQLRYLNLLFPKETYGNLVSFYIHGRIHKYWVIRANEREREREREMSSAWYSAGSVGCNMFSWNVRYRLLLNQYIHKQVLMVRNCSNSKFEQQQQLRCAPLTHLCSSCFEWSFVRTSQIFHASYTAHSP